MRKTVSLIILSLFLFAVSCKRECYQCNQYCLYCLNKSDSSFAIRVCADNFAGQHAVDSLKGVLEDTGHICSFINNQNAVCDGKNKIINAINYYQQENYYCTPQ